MLFIENLAVSTNHAVNIEGKTAIVVQCFEPQSEYAYIIRLHFQIVESLRFGIRFLIPARCTNACVTLNDELLLGLFSEYLPPGSILPYQHRCSDRVEPRPHTTLAPGKLQTVNFRWNPGDSLLIYLYFNESSSSYFHH